MSERIEVFKNMLENDPDNTMVLFGLANEYLKANEFFNAATTLEEYLKYGTDEGAAFGMLARAYEAIGETDKAKQAYEKGIEVSIANGHPSMAQEYTTTLEIEYDQ